MAAITTHAPAAGVVVLAGRTAPIRWLRDIRS
jgi:hypothetical protein